MATRLLREQRKHATDPATMADVAAAYGNNLRRTVVLGVLYVVLAVSFFGYTAQQYVSQQEYTHRECVARNANVDRSNDLYRRLSAYWRTAHRPGVAAIYDSVTLSVPRC